MPAVSSLQGITEFLGVGSEQRTCALRAGPEGARVRFVGRQALTELPEPRRWPQHLRTRFGGTALRRCAALGPGQAAREGPGRGSGAARGWEEATSYSESSRGSFSGPRGRADHKTSVDEGGGRVVLLRSEAVAWDPLQRWPTSTSCP